MVHDWTRLVRYGLVRTRQFYRTEHFHQIIVPVCLSRRKQRAGLETSELGGLGRLLD